ncbi:DUF6421 family protein [Streptomyces zagrosensis]|uniref:Uncharacterized protein n=1 Tax=Streptomyces zagrosensis TaxID=1042984 RepID=A0A7W9UZE4_9ACTN|nr:DUF6421 family protein [Streptomyces zagrosensis]MBB5935699.1 hypothetical protein [Streptomyces zagrosensis]
MSGEIRYAQADGMRAEADTLTRTLIPRVDAFRARQRDDGTVSEPGAPDARALRSLADDAARWFARHGRHRQADALVADATDWLAAGLDTPPHFARSRDALAAPADGGWAAFLAPVRTTNSAPPVGQRMEFFLVRRQEPAALNQLAARYPHPKNNCQATVLLAGSAGFARGNCIVFFPENVAAHDRVTAQAYAIFTFSKFRKIHETYALPSAEAVLTANSVPRASSGLDPHTCYQARSLWGYLHDYFHHQGAWPLDQHIKLKMNWFVGLLEETKVDAQTALACAEGDVPHAAEQIDMILLERMFRYPLADDAVRNFDAGTGVFLYSWLRSAGALTQRGERLSLDRARLLTALRELVTAITQLESHVTTAAEYRAAATAFVRRFLPAGEPGDRYRFTEDQRILLRAREHLASLPPLHFVPGES